MAQASVHYPIGPTITMNNGHAVFITLVPTLSLKRPISRRSLRIGSPHVISYLLNAGDALRLNEFLSDLGTKITPEREQLRAMMDRMRPNPGSVSIDHGLSKREMDVLAELVEGSSYKMIACDLNISFETVRTHIKRIYTKLQVHNCTEAVAKALRTRILDHRNVDVGIGPDDRERDQ